ncbi:MAG TPA: hypothetical protein VHA09_02915 [Nitrososphaera sp.]|nr:hypothetical protein [Nitrososphaera sp.]
MATRDLRVPVLEGEDAVELKKFDSRELSAEEKASLSEAREF